MNFTNYGSQSVTILALLKWKLRYLWRKKKISVKQCVQNVNVYKAVWKKKDQKLGKGHKVKKKE